MGIAKTIILLIFFLMAGPAQAFFSSTTNSWELRFLVGVKALHGSNASEDETTVVDRKHIVYGADAVLGLRWKFLMAGVGADYSLWRQLDDPSEVSNSNTQGKMLNKSFVLGAGLGNLGFLAKLHLSSEYEFDEQSASAASQTLVDPSGSYTLQLLWRWSPNTYIGVDYTKVTNTRAEVNGVENAIADNAQLNFTGVGLTYGYTF